ncbi:MAG: GTPase ObgE [Bacteroidota bacterium]|nr:GTPase ObgE [Bacteroidota bacterium]
MPQANFIDHVIIHCRSGKGGQGSVHFYRDRTTPKGGPDGGNGGRGGHIILRGTTNRWTLLHLRYRKHIFAENGGQGQGANKTGADGEDVYLDVPLGTVAKDSESGQILFEITEHGQEHTLNKGGRGGLGNTNFKSPTNRTPRYAQPGEKAEESTRILELKVLADVGLVGFPNAGKSTLLSVVSAAKPKIANYEFTTLTPNLGMIKYRDEQSFVMADIPGIIEGASEGKGLGHQFLRHIERNSVLLFMVPAEVMDIAEQYKTLLLELEKYNPELLDKQRILAITKSDMLDEELIEATKEELPDLPHVFISSVAQTGLIELKDMIWKAMNN